MRRELATAPAWVLSRGIEMAKTENRKPIGKKTDQSLHTARHARVRTHGSVFDPGGLFRKYTPRAVLCPLLAPSVSREDCGEELEEVAERER